MQARRTSQPPRPPARPSTEAGAYADLERRPREPRGPFSKKRFTVDSVVRFLLWTGALVAAGWLMWYFSWLIVYLVGGGLLAHLMRPAVHRLQSLGLPQAPAILLTFVIVFGGLAVAVVSLAPFVVGQVVDLSQQMSVEAIAGTVRSLDENLREAFPFVQEGREGREGIVVETLRDVWDTLFRGDRIRGAVGSVVSVFTDIVYMMLAIPFVTFFFLRDGTQLRHATLRFVPNRYFEITLAIIAKVETNLGRYLQALLIQCTLVALVASTALYFVGLNYALAVGIFAGLANSIPYFGPFVGFVAGTLVGVAQTGDFSLVAGVFVAMALTQITDNLLFQPLIFSRAAQAHPMVILFVVLIGAQLGGIVGMLIAIPLATTVRVVARQVLWSLRNYRILGAR